MFDGSFSPEARELLRRNAAMFLAAVNSCSETEAMNLPLTWQIFPESPLLRDMPFLEAQILHSSLRKKWSTLLARNEDGYHVGLCASRMSPSIAGRPCRDKEHVASFAYLVVDLDMKDRDTETHPQLPTYDEALTLFAPMGSEWCPTVLVDSGHGYHLYYALEGLQQAGKWPQILRARLGLWQHWRGWGSDKTCAQDPAKTLRMPGTQNLKYFPVPCRVMQICRKSYRLEDLIEAFPYKEPIKPEIQHSGFIYKPTHTNQFRIEKAYLWLLEQEPAVQGSYGSDACLKAAWVGPRFCLDFDLALELMMKYYNPECAPEWSESEMRHKLAAAYESALQLGLYGCGMPDFKKQSDLAFLTANTDMFGVEDAE